MVMYDDPAARFEECVQRAQALLREEKYAEALAALDDIPKRYQLRAAVLDFRCQIHLAAQQWENAAGIAQHLAKVDSEQPAYWVHWAYAVRRWQSIGEAEKILRIALALHPECAIIHFNLACYASQTGRLGEARTLLEAAVRLDDKCRAQAAQDADLEPLMAALAADDPLRPDAAS